MGVSVTATDERYELSFTPSAISVRLAADVAYGDCNDFLAHYATMASDDEVTNIRKKIVGNCTEARKEFLNGKFLVRESAAGEYPVDLDQWDIVVGKGKYYSPPKGETFLREAVQRSAHNIVYRYCADCQGTHQHIFYKRITASRRDFNFLILSWIIGLTRIMSWVWTLTFSHHMRMQQMIRIPGFFATTMTLRSDSPVIVVPLDTNHISGIDFIIMVGDIIGHILSKKMLPLMHFEGINFED